jgi:hypothetical protein
MKKLPQASNPSGVPALGVEIQMKTTASSNIMTAGNRHSKIHSREES